jgi:DNA polymerase-3 subunit delta
MTYEDIEKAWSKGQAEPVYVFFGEEDFLRSELVHVLVDQFLPDEGTRSFNYDLLYGGDVQLRDVLSMAQSYPVMADRRVVIVREAEKLLKTKVAGTKSSGKNKQMQEDPLIAYLKNPNKETILLFDMLKMGPRNQSPFKELAAKAVNVEFAPMKEAAVSQWIRARAKKLGSNVSESAARLMIAHLGTSLRVHANELEKLQSFTSGSKEITESDVENVVGVSREFNVFELQKAIGAGQKSAAVRIALGILSAGGDQKQFLFVMLARYVEQLIVARELTARGEGERAIADALELRGGAAFFVKDYISAAKRYSRERLDKAMRSIIETEQRTRRVKLDDALVVESLILDLMPA